MNEVIATYSPMSGGTPATTVYVDNWDEILGYLYKLEYRRGSFELESQTAESASLSLIADCNMYLLTKMYEENGDFIVEPVDDFVSGGLKTTDMVELLGDSWDPSMITTNFDFIIQKFKLFYLKEVDMQVL